MTNLTVKQEKFCQHYAAHGNASEAYRHAYNTENMQSKSVNEKACVLLKEVKVAARVAELAEGYAEKAELTAEFVLKGLQEVYARCMEDGEAFNAAGANKSLELLGKHLKLFTEKVEHGGDGSPLNIVVRRFSEEENNS